MRRRASRFWNQSSFSSLTRSFHSVQARYDGKKQFNARNMATILLIDDANTIRKVCGQILVQAGHEVRTASRAQEAIRGITEQGAPDLIITDIDMPGMNGLELCDRIRQAGGQLPIVVITSYSEKEMIIKAKTLNLAGWLLKPVTPDNLIQKVNDALALRSR